MSIDFAKKFSLTFPRAALETVAGGEPGHWPWATFVVNILGAFLLGYFGATILALVIGVMALIQLRQPGSWLVLVGAVFVILGAVITIAFNVPLNNHLDTVNPDGLSVADAAREWQAYFSTWTAWNHARTVTSFVGAVVLLAGLRYR